MASVGDVKAKKTQRGGRVRLAVVTGLPHFTFDFKPDDDRDRQQTYRHTDTVQITL